MASDVIDLYSQCKAATTYNRSCVDGKHMHVESATAGHISYIGVECID